MSRCELLSHFYFKKQISITAQTKMFGNWRQIISIKDAEYCALMKDPSSVVAKFIMQWEPYAQGFIRQCPYEIGPLKIYNFTDTLYQQLDKLDRKGGQLPVDFNQRIAEGQFRVRIKLNTKDDRNALDVTIAMSINFRQAEGF